MAALGRGARLIGFNGPEEEEAAAAGRVRGAAQAVLAPAGSRVMRAARMHGGGDGGGGWVRAGGPAAPHSPRASLARRGHCPARVSRGNAPTFASPRRARRARRRSRAARPGRQVRAPCPGAPGSAARLLARSLGVLLQTFFICLLIGCYSSE